MNNETERSEQPEQTHGLPKSVWGNLPEESEGYMKFTPENLNTIQIRFIDNEPRQAPSKFDKEKFTYEFEVIDLIAPTPVVKIFSVSSIRLMRKLEALTPLDGKALKITRTGELMKTDYIVIPIV